MHNLTVELREYPLHATLSEDIAELITERTPRGKIVIVAKSPKSLQASVVKYWQQLESQQTISSSTESQKESFSGIKMEKQITFSHNYDNFEPTASITFATIDELLALPPVCQTLIVTHECARSDLYLATGWMPDKALVVIYDK